MVLELMSWLATVVMMVQRQFSLDSLSDVTSGDESLSELINDKRAIVG